MIDKKELNQTIRNVIKEVEVEKTNEAINEEITQLETEYKLSSIASIILLMFVVARWIWITTNNQMNFENKFKLVMMLMGHSFLCLGPLCQKLSCLIRKRNKIILQKH